MAVKVNLVAAGDFMNFKQQQDNKRRADKIKSLQAEIAECKARVNSWSSHQKFHIGSWDISIDVRDELWPWPENKYESF